MPYELTESEWRDAGVARTDVMLAPDELAQFEQVFRARAYGTAQPK